MSVDVIERIKYNKRLDYQTENKCSWARPTAHGAPLNPGTLRPFELAVFLPMSARLNISFMRIKHRA